MKPEGESTAYIKYISIPAYLENHQG